MPPIRARFRTGATQVPIDDLVTGFLERNQGDDGLAALDARGDSLATWQNREGIKTAWHPSLFP